MTVKNVQLTLDEMEPIAREATRRALRKYPEPSQSDQAEWTLGKFETKEEGILEIYVPSEKPLEARVISRARVNKISGAVSVDVFL